MPGMTQSDIDKHFDVYATPTENEIDRMQMITNAGLEFASKILEYSPSSPEQTIAIRKAQEAVFWANSAVVNVEE